MKSNKSGTNLEALLLNQINKYRRRHRMPQMEIVPTDKVDECPTQKADEYLARVEREMADAETEAHLGGQA